MQRKDMHNVNARISSANRNAANEFQHAEQATDGLLLLTSSSDYGDGAGIAPEGYYTGFVVGANGVTISSIDVSDNPSKVPNINKRKTMKRKTCFSSKKPTPKSNEKHPEKNATRIPSVRFIAIQKRTWLFPSITFLILVLSGLTSFSGCAKGVWA